MWNLYNLRFIIGILIFSETAKKHIHISSNMTINWRSAPHTHTPKTPKSVKILNSFQFNVVHKVSLPPTSQYTSHLLDIFNLLLHGGFTEMWGLRTVGQNRPKSMTPKWLKMALLGIFGPFLVVFGYFDPKITQNPP